MKFNPHVVDCSAAPIAEAWSWLENPDDPDLLDVCQAVPSYPPHASLLEYLGSELASGNGSYYTDIQGIEPLRNALARDINSRYRASVNRDNIVITAGCNQAFCSVIDAICQSGDNVVLPSPGYFNHAMWLDIRNIHCRWIPFNKSNGIPDPESARNLFDDRTRAIVLVSPNNPTGAIYPPQILAAYQELAVDRGIPLIVDETYRDFMDEANPPHELFDTDDWENHFIHLYSFSKAYSLTGHRVGAIVAGQKLIEQLMKIQDCVLISAPHSGQLAALFGLENLGWWRAEKGQVMIDRAEAIRNAFSHPDLDYHLICAGAYFAYVKHPFDEPAQDIAKRLAQEFKVICLPGNYFGENQQSYMRMAFANIDESRFPELIDRLLISQG